MNKELSTRIPGFEGHPVAGTVVKMTGAMPSTELDDVVIGVDDIVQMVAQFRCVGVRHEVNDKTGDIVRVQLLRPIEMMPLAFEDNEDGPILRALPRYVTGKVEQ